MTARKSGSRSILELLPRVLYRLLCNLIILGNAYRSCPISPIIHQPFSTAASSALSDTRYCAVGKLHDLPFAVEITEERACSDRPVDQVESRLAYKLTTQTGLT